MGDVQMAACDIFSPQIFKFQIPSLQANTDGDVCDDTLHENCGFSIRQKA
jgi:hypothetical protein